jgi:hypothetical protein
MIQDINIEMITESFEKQPKLRIAGAMPRGGGVRGVV